MKETIHPAPAQKFSAPSANPPASSALNMTAENAEGIAEARKGRQTSAGAFFVTLLILGRNGRNFRAQTSSPIQTEDQQCDKKCAC